MNDIPSSASITEIGEEKKKEVSDASAGGDTTLDTLSKIIAELRSINSIDGPKFEEGVGKSVDILLFALHSLATVPEHSNVPNGISLRGWNGSLSDLETRKIVQHSDHSTGLARQVRNMLTAMHLLRKSLASLIIRVLESITVPIESDPSGYLAANLIFFNSLLQGVIESHVNSLKDIQDASQAVLSHSDLSPQTLNAISSAGNLFLLYHHTDCKACGAKPVVARSFTSPNIVLCAKCIAKERI